MSKVIQLIKTAGNNYIFVYGQNNAGEIIYRSSHNISHLQKETPHIANGMVKLSLYDFHTAYIDKVNYENSL